MLERSLAFLLHPVYHGTVCPELRLPAKPCQFLPARKAHGPRCSEKEHPPHLDGGRALYHDDCYQGAPATLVTTSILAELQRTADSDVQDYLHYTIGARNAQTTESQRYFSE
jgi:hypothetical protein